MPAHHLSQPNHTPSGKQHPSTDALPARTASGLPDNHHPTDPSPMIVTLTQNPAGQQRLYLGGKSSLEAWLEPNADHTGWTFHLDEAVTGNRLSDTDRRTWALHTLLELARLLDVPPEDLAAVPWETLTTLHGADPYANRRMAAPKRRAAEQAFVATPPNIRRPATDFHSPHQEFTRSRR